MKINAVQENAQLQNQKHLSFYSSIFCFDHCGLCHLYFPAIILGQDLLDLTNLATLRLEIYFYSLQYHIWNLN